MDTVTETLQARAGQHGSFADNANLSQELKTTIRKYPGYLTLGAVEREALDMILHKCARAVNSTVYHNDNYVDIAGYATLVTRELSEEGTGIGKPLEVKGSTKLKPGMPYPPLNIEGTHLQASGYI